MKKLKLGIPNGSLQQFTLNLFKKAGFNIFVDERSYRPSIDDEEIECLLLRPQEIPTYVEQGYLDLGLSGKDLILENNADVEEIADLIYAKQGLGRVKIVLAVPENSNIKSVKNLKGKRIVTELVNVTRNYLKRNKVKATVEFSWGATEAKVPQLADAIVDLTETGSSLRANQLKIIDTILEFSTMLIANKKSMRDPWKKQKIEKIALLLTGVMFAEGKVGLKMNLEKKNLNKILSVLPALKSPTVSELADKNWLALEIIVEEKIVRELIPQFKKLGAKGIVEYPLNKIIE